MIVSITGGTGFIGRKLVLRHAALGDEVRVLSRRAPEKVGLPDSVRLWHGDLLSLRDLSSFVDGADVFYHCAAEILDNSRMADLHVGGTRSLINAVAGRIGRWVQLSSTGAYGPRREGIVTEESSLQPSNTYETTKVKSDELVTSAAARGAFNHVILRPSNVYGAQMTNRSLFGLIKMIHRGMFFFIGKPGASANYIHVDNVVEAIIRCGSEPSAIGRMYNVSDYRPLEEFIGLVSAALGRRSSPFVRVPEGPVRAVVRLLPPILLTESRIDALTSRVIYSNARIERELGYRHSISMEEGLGELVHAWKQQSGAL